MGLTAWCIPHIPVRSLVTVGHVPERGGISAGFLIPLSSSFISRIYSVMGHYLQHKKTLTS